MNSKLEPEPVAAQTREAHDAPSHSTTKQRPKTAFINATCRDPRLATWFEQQEQQRFAASADASW